MNVLNFDSKQCERVRRQLDAYVSNELLVETTSEVLKHLEAHICSVPGSPREYVHFIAREERFFR